jgi:cell wall-associated NlpC family hydrolase
MAVAVIAAGLWTSPSAVRPVDGPALERPARIRDWTAAQGSTERRQLWGVLDTQVLLGDVVLVDEVAQGWARVVVPSQPSRRDPRGYPGWIPLSQLDIPAEPAETSVVVTVPVTDLRTEPGGAVALADVSFATVLPAGRRQDGWIEVNLPGGATAWVSEVDTEAYLKGPHPKPEQVIEAGRQFVGLMYLAGGCHGLALDCSSLVHLIYRRFGQVTPRDAADEAGIGDEVAIDDLEPGDLLFFAKPDTGFVYHCGICLGMPGMLHVSQTDWACLDGPMTDVRRGHLIGGRRLR